MLLFEMPKNPFLNMAFEEAFVRVRASGLIEDDTLRLWRNENAIVLGYFRKVNEDVRLDFAKKISAKIVRRFTGGGTVYHDLGNLNYAIVVKPEKKVQMPIDYIYSKLISGALIALRKLGVNPYLVNINDIVVNNRKISGTAATLYWNALFLHGALLVSTDLAKLNSVLKIPNEIKTKKIDPVKYRVTRLIDVLERKISMRELIETFVLGFEEALSAEAYYDMPSREEIEITYLLYKGRYLSKKWNLERHSIFEYKDLEKEINEILKK